MSPVQIGHDEHGRMLHFTLKGAVSLAVGILTMLTIIGSSFWWFWTTSAEAVTAWNRMQSTMSQNTMMLGDIKRQMATDRSDGTHALLVASSGLSDQISKISDRIDGIQDRTRMLEINQARVLEALKRQGIVDDRSGQ